MEGKGKGKEGGGEVGRISMGWSLDDRIGVLCGCFVFVMVVEYGR